MTRNRHILNFFKLFQFSRRKMLFFERYLVKKEVHRAYPLYQGKTMFEMVGNDLNYIFVAENVNIK